MLRLVSLQFRHGGEITFCALTMLRPPAISAEHDHKRYKQRHAGCVIAVRGLREGQLRVQDAIVHSPANDEEANRSALMPSRTNAIEGGNAQSMHGGRVAPFAFQHASRL